MSVQDEGGVSQDQLKEYAKKQTQKYEECKAELGRASAEIEALKSLKSIREQVQESAEPDQTEHEIRLLKKAVQDKCVENQKLTEERSRLTDRTKALLRKYKELKKKVAQPQPQPQPQAEVAELNGDSPALGELGRLQEENEELKAALESSRREIAAKLAQEKEKYEKKKGELVKEADALRGALENFATGATEHTQVEKDLRQQIQDLQHLYRQGEEVAQTLQGRIDALTAEGETKEAGFKEVEDKLIRELQAATAGLAERQNRLDSFQGLSEQLTRAQNHVESLRAELEQQAVDSQCRLDEVEKQAEYAKEALVERIRELENSRNESGTSHEGNEAVVDLRDELNRVKLELEAAKVELAAKGPTIKSDSNQNGVLVDLQAELAHVKLELQAARAGLTSQGPYLEPSEAQNVDEKIESTKEGYSVELAVEAAKVYALTEMVEYVSIEKVRESARAALAEKNCKEMERKGIDLSKKFAQKYKLAKAKLQKEVKNHSQTSELVESLKGELHQLKLEFQTEKEEWDMRVQTLEGSIESLVREKNILAEQNETFCGVREQLASERKSREDESERNKQLAQEIETLSKQIEQLTADREEYSLKLRHAQNKVHEAISKAEESNSLPESLDISESVLCTITVRDMVWVCVAIKNQECKWFEKSTFLRKLQERKGSVSVNLQSSLPLPLEVQFREQNEKDLQAAQSETATALAQIETLRGELAQYKRRAQVALKKAQEDAGQELSQRVMDVEAQLSQVQAELVKVTQERDGLKAETEAHNAVCDSLSTELKAEQREREVLEKEVIQLKGSLKEQLVAVTTKLEGTHEKNLNEERISFRKQLEYLRQANANETKRCEQLTLEIDEMHRSAGSERGQLQALEAQVVSLQGEIAKLGMRLGETEQDNIRLRNDAEKLRSTQKQPSEVAADPQPETQPKDHGDTYSIPLFFDSIRKQQEDERIAWQREREKSTSELRQLRKQNEGLLSRLQVLEAAAKENKRSLKRQNSFGGGTPEKAEALTYLKNVVLKYVSAKDQSERKTLLPVLATMLQFSSEELVAAKAVVESDSGGVTSWLSF